MMIKLNQHEEVTSGDETITLPDEIHLVGGKAHARHADSDDVIYPSLEALCAAYKLDPEAVRTALFYSLLRKHDACGPAMEWLNGRSPEAAWRECHCADWMLWLATLLPIEHKLFVTLACRAARTVLHIAPAYEDRPRIAIETTERWLIGEATIEEVRAAGTAASDAGCAAHDAGRAARTLYSRWEWPAWAASDAAASVDTRAAAAEVINNVTLAMVDVDRAQHDLADLVREVIPWDVVKAALWG